MNITKEEFKQIVREELEAAISEKKKKKPNPWAICTSQVGRGKKAKYERCVKKIKIKHNITET